MTKKKNKHVITITVCLTEEDVNALARVKFSDMDTTDFYDDVSGFDLANKFIVAAAEKISFEVC